MQQLSKLSRLSKEEWLRRRRRLAVAQNNLFLGGGAINISDSFTAADGTALAGRVSETGGKIWQALGATYTIQSGAAQLASGTLFANVLDAGSANVHVTLKMVTNGNNWLVFRAVDRFNFLLFRISGANVQLYRVEQGVFTSLATANGVAAAGDIFEVDANGFQVSCYRNGAVVPGFSNLAVNYCAQAVKHGIGSGTVGDRVDDFEIIPAENATSTPYPAAIIFWGNSLTYGSGASGPAGRYPNQVIAALSGSYAWTNQGIGGQTTTQMLATQDADSSNQYTSLRPKTGLVIWELRNDIANGGVSAATAYANYATLCQKARDRGFVVVAVTCLPSSGLSDATRATVNANIAANYASFAHALADVAADTTIGQNGQNTNLTYYNADGIHMTDAGYTIVAGLVKTALNAVGIS